tara:strand:+ start:2088 stop:2897 length:810 start_codon:yes stop_codon:yes gene_type:complete
MIIDPERVAKIMRETAEIDVLPRFQKLSESEIMEKAPGDIVTVADYDAEKRLTAALKDLLPGADILAEEAASRDGLDLEDYQSARTTWLIDPVDGTRNFSKGDPTFAIVIALVKGGQTEIAWIHLPVEDQTIIAERGSGAFFNSEERLALSPPPDISGMTGLLNLRAMGDDVSLEQIKERAHTFSALKNFRCAGYDFVELARDRKHFSLYRRLWPWDHAAGTLIFREAGGYAARVDGQPYNPLSRILGLLCAPDKQSWQSIYDHLATPN